MKKKEKKNSREEYEERKKVTKKTKKEHKRKKERREERKEKEKKTEPKYKVCLPLLLLKLPLPPCVLDLLLLLNCLLLSTHTTVSCEGHGVKKL